MWKTDEKAGEEKVEKHECKECKESAKAFKGILVCLAIFILLLLGSCGRDLYFQNWKYQILEKAAVNPNAVNINDLRRAFGE